MATQVHLGHLSPLLGHVVARAIHATADLDYAQTMCGEEEALGGAVEALKGGAAIVTDVEMTRAGLARPLFDRSHCYLDQARVARAGGGMDGETLSEVGIDLACEHHSQGAIFVIGCAPTALARLISHARSGLVRPAFVVGLPVGFVGAAESKAQLARSGLTHVTNVGDKGGSAVAAAVTNALWRLANGANPPEAPRC